MFWTVSPKCWTPCSRAPSGPVLRAAGRHRRVGLRGSRRGEHAAGRRKAGHHRSTGDTEHVTAILIQCVVLLIFVHEWSPFQNKRGRP